MVMLEGGGWERGGGGGGGRGRLPIVGFQRYLASQFCGDFLKLHLNM